MNGHDELFAEVMVRPLKSVHVAIEQACLHPLVRHAVIDERGYVQWPHLTERQKQVAADTVRLIRVDGRQYFSLPPRVNADWFLPENPTPDDLRTATAACTICSAGTCRSISQRAHVTRCSSRR